MLWTGVGVWIGCGSNGIIWGIVSIMSGINSEGCHLVSCADLFAFKPMVQSRQSYMCITSKLTMSVSD